MTIEGLHDRFDAERVQLAARCKILRDNGLTLAAVANQLNDEGVLTKTGKPWNSALVLYLLKRPDPPPPKSSNATTVAPKKRKRKLGVTKANDIRLGWVSEKHPEYEAWRRLCFEWLKGCEVGLANSIRGANSFIEYLISVGGPSNPADFFRPQATIPDFYETQLGPRRTTASVDVNNCVHAFLNWVLTTPDYCEEDDYGRLQTSPAFRNPVPRQTKSGAPRLSESVRSTLPYGYIDELRMLIAAGRDFKDWKWAHTALGPVAPPSDANQLDEESAFSTDWYQVDPSLIDKNDPDCVWRKRLKQIDEPGVKRRAETIFEMWSPVRWVALLIKLQLPLRTFQVRMLDSGEADTWKWHEGRWIMNPSPLAGGSERRPHANGIFRRPNQLVDGDVKVLLYVNTNKTADQKKAGSAKGYVVPWILGGPCHQDPFYWIEKLRNWQEKYNPLDRPTSWHQLDGRQIHPKSDIQLSAYPDTTFLFRMAGNSKPYLPIGINALDRPWFLCLEEMEKRLLARGETLADGQPIRLLPGPDYRRKGAVVTLFPLHSLRVSLITALAIDGSVPLAILQKIAGHSRLIMTLYYTKPGAAQHRREIQAGVQRLNDSASRSIIDWMANAEYRQLVEKVIANDASALRLTVPEPPHLRSAAGLMGMIDGLCLVGGNNIEVSAPGCHNGGANIGNTTAPRYAPVTGGARNCPMCRWFITMPQFIPQLAARWNNLSYHSHDAREAVVAAEQAFRDIDDRRAEALHHDAIFQDQQEYVEAQRVLENSLQKFDALTQTLAAVTKLLERCRIALIEDGDANAIVAQGSNLDFQYAIQTVDSELLQVSGISEGAILYPDLDPGKAILRQSQLLDAALMRSDLSPVFLTLSETEQKAVGSAFLQNLATRMNPENPALGRYEIISLIDAGESVRERLGSSVADSLRLAMDKSKAIPLSSIGHSRKAAA